MLCNKENKNSMQEEQKEQSFEEILKDFLNFPDCKEYQLVDVQTLKNLIIVHEQKYVNSLLEADGERDLMKVNVGDFLKYDEAIQKTAIMHAKAIKYGQDPDYFAKNKIDRDLMLPIQIAQVIEDKRTGVKVLNDKSDFYFNLIRQLRSFLVETENNSRKTFIERVINIFK